MTTPVAVSVAPKWRRLGYPVAFCSTQEKMTGQGKPASTHWKCYSLSLRSTP